MASRRGNDKDNLGNAVTKEIEVIVPHDQGN
jgi:hypothetical protein